MKKVVEVTIIKSINEGTYESESKITALGYNEENAKSDALSTLKYACCSDFNNPASCQPGTTIQYFSAEGIEVESGTDEEEFADEMNWGQAIIMEFNGTHYAFNENYDEYHVGDSITSDEVRQLDSWEDI